MQTQSTKEIPYGFILIIKPVGPTSHDIIDKLRKITGIKKIGHAGTLDPMASGLLFVAVGRQATRQIGRFIKEDKHYIAELRLGELSDTFDSEGVIKKIKAKPGKVTEKQIKKVLQSFIGKQKQLPPMFSAKKVKGQKLYKLARQGKTIKREATDIEIFSIRLISFNWPDLQIAIHCSSGTYIRSLANSIGQGLLCGAYLSKLNRTAIGKFEIRQGVKIAEINKKNWQKLLFIPSAPK